MRGWLLAAAVVLSCACAGPIPCTQALCPSRVDGSYRVHGWTGSVTVTPGVPAIPIVSDATVDVLSGRVEFVNDHNVIRASAGSSFLFQVSSDDEHVPILIVSTGEVAVALSSSAAPSPLAVGLPYFLPAFEQ